MKLQLTRSKTIEINFPSRNGKKQSQNADITGVELFADLPDGCPAVRLARKKDTWKLLATGFVPGPDGSLPEKWEDTPKQPRWDLPPFFQAPHAALAVNSAQAAFSAATTDAILKDLSTGSLPSQEESATPEKKRLGIHRAETPRPTEAKTPAPGKKVEKLPDPGVPTSVNGMRYTVKPLAEAGFHLEAVLPEFQALWLSRLLPEGRRPTTSSIQLRDAALLASVLAQPLFREANGNALVVFVGATSVHFAGYKAGAPVLWRKCPSLAGETAIREAVKHQLKLEDALVDSVLNDTLVDPSNAMEPFLGPIFRELELSRAYLSGKHAVNPNQIILMGLSAGALYWKRFAHDLHKIDLVTPDVFEGIERSSKTKSDFLLENPSATRDNQFLVALGAALAASEVDL